MIKNNIIVIALTAIVAATGGYLAGRQGAVPNIGSPPKDDGGQSLIGKLVQTKPAGKIAFVSAGSIRIIDPDGKNEKILAQGDNPMWSPDGKTIAYLGSKEVASPAGDTNPTHSISILNIVGVDGGNGKELAQCDSFLSCMDIGIVAWSPNGENILLAEHEHFDNRETGEDRDVYTLNLFDIGNGQKTKLAQNEKEAYSAAFSPDGKKIAYCPHSDWKMGMMNVDGSADEDFGVSCGDKMQWSSDGKIIAMDNSIVDAGQKTEMQFELGRLDGFSIAPDGKTIAYEGDLASLFIVNSDGTQNKQLLGERSCYNRPSWSPDGKKLVFSGMNKEIIVFDLESQNQEKIGYLQAVDGKTLWSPE